MPAPPPPPGRPLARRALLAGAAATAAGALTSACGTAAGQGPGKVAIDGDNVTWNKPLAAAGRRLRGATGVRLVPRVIPSVESFEQVVKSSLRTSKTPDMLKYWSGYRLTDLARTGGIRDLTALWDAAARKGWVNPALRPSFTSGGRVYALPMNLTYYVFFYNPEVFADHRLQPPCTWDDFLALCERLKANGITPLHATTNGRWPAFIWFMEILTRQDPRFYQELMNGRASYTDPPAVRALQTVKSFADRGWFTPLDMPHTDAAAAVVHGDLGLMPGGTFMTSSFTDAGGKPGKDVGAFILPMADPEARPSLVFESSALVCTVKGPDGTDALKAASGWLRPEVQRAFTDALQDGSPNPRVRPANSMLDGVFRQAREQKLWLHNRFWEASPPELVEATVDDLAAFLIEPESYREVLRTMQGRADEAWKVWREAGSQ